MIASYNREHVPHIIIDNFLNEGDLSTFNEDFYRMYDHCTDGHFVQNGVRGVVDKSFKSRREFEIYQLTDEHGLRIPEIWSRNFWNRELRNFYAQSEMFAYLNVTNSDNLLGSFYGAGDFYKEHADFAIFTAIFFHQDEKNFEGGDFMLGNVTQWNINNAEYKRIKYKRNRVLIFPSRFVHYAEQVTISLADGIDGMRLCTQNFLSFHRDYK